MTANHVTVTVNSGRNIGNSKNGKADSFVAIQLGDKKFRTSIVPKSNSPTWNEQCEFSFSNKYSVLTLTVYHRSFFGFDELLGQLRLPLDEICELNTGNYRNRWYPLKGKSGRKDEHKYAGELEIRLEFCYQQLRGSLTSTEDKLYSVNNNKERQSSFLDIRNAVKHAISSRKESPSRQRSELTITNGQKKRRSSDMFTTSKSLTVPQLVVQPSPPDEQDDYVLNVEKSVNDDLQKQKISKSLPRAASMLGDDRPVQIFRTMKSEGDDSTAVQDKRNNTLRLAEHRLRSSSSMLNLAGAPDVFYDTMTKKDLIELLKKQRLDITKLERRARELEDYIDQLVLRVIDVQPSLLKGPFVRRTKLYIGDQ